MGWFWLFLDHVSDGASGFLGFIVIMCILDMVGFIEFLDHRLFSALFELVLFICFILLIKNTLTKQGRSDMKELINTIRVSKNRGTLIDDWFKFAAYTRQDMLEAKATRKAEKKKNKA